MDRAAASDGHIVSTETPRLVERKRRETRRWKNKCHGRSVVASFLMRAVHAKAARHGTARGTVSHTLSTRTRICRLLFLFPSPTCRRHWNIKPNRVVSTLPQKMSTMSTKRMVKKKTSLKEGKYFFF